MHESNTFLGEQYMILPIQMSAHTQTDRRIKVKTVYLPDLGGYNYFSVHARTRNYKLLFAIQCVTTRPPNAFKNTWIVTEKIWAFTAEQLVYTVHQ